MGKVEIDSNDLEDFSIRPISFLLIIIILIGVYIYIVLFSTELGICLRKYFYNLLTGQVTYDLEGTYTLNGAEAEMEGEITHNNLALKFDVSF